MPMKHERENFFKKEIEQKRLEVQNRNISRGNG